MNFTEPRAVMVLLFILSVLTACRPSPQPNAPEVAEKKGEDTTETDTPVVKTPIFQRIESDKSTPEILGTVVDKQYWLDKKGFWCCVLTETIDVPNEYGEFRLYKFKEDSLGEYELNQLYLDSTRCGDADVVAFTDTKTLLITDLDQDDVGEITFGYTLSCTYDVSPQERVLMLNQGTNLYELEGFTLDFGYEIPDSNDLNLEDYAKDEDGYWFVPHTSGRYENDNAFEALPDTFLRHMNNVWLDILAVDYRENQKAMGE